MRFNIKSISKIMVALLILMNLCYFLIAFGWTSLFADSFVSKPRMMLFFLMIAIAIVCVPLYKSKYMWVEISILALLWVRAIIGAIVSDMEWDDALLLLRSYLYPLLAFPIYSLLKDGGWNFKSFLKFLVVVITIDTLIRMIDSFAENLTGSLLWENLVSGEMGYRNDIYRINPSTFEVLVLPIIFYLFSKANTFKEKCKWIVCLAINLIYAIIIWQARSAIIYKIFLLVVLFYMQRIKKKTKIYRILIGVIIGFFCIPFVLDFIGTFLSTNSDFGSSTIARMNAIEYFMNIYIENPFFGVGLLPSEERYAIGGGALADLGLIYGLVQLGIPMMIYYVVIFGRGIYVYQKLKETAQAEALLVLSLTISFILFNINIDTFYMFALSVPIYIAITEYLYFKFKRKKFCNFLHSDKYLLNRNF